MTYYKIRSRSHPELFRKSDGTWSATGKVYDTLGKLRAVITQRLNTRSEHLRSKLDDWEIVEYEVRVKAVKQLHEVVRPEQVFDILKR